jgi:hypothetical protein
VTAQRDVVKKHAIERLDREAAVHASGHQNVHARRYLMPKTGRSGVEVLIIVKGAQLQLWCEAGGMDRAVSRQLGGSFRPGSETYATRNDKGDPQYGRHSALKTMNRLHRGDAWRFVPGTVSELDGILNAIKGP